MCLYHPFQAIPTSSTGENVNSNAQMQISPEKAKPDANGHTAPEEMTSKDYYFDSYAHFGIHEVRPIEIVK